MKKFFCEAVANNGGAMEADTISKNGASSKSHTSRANFFRKAVLALSVVSIFSATSISAQEKGDMAFGGHLMLALDDALPTAGIGPMFQINVSETFRLEGAFTYFFPKKEEIRVWGTNIETTLNMWVFSVNGHYLFPISDKVVLYPLAGVSIVGLKATASGGGQSASASNDPENSSYINIGAGIQLNISDNARFNFEPKYLGGAFMISAGIAFSF